MTNYRADVTRFSDTQAPLHPAPRGEFPPETYKKGTVPNFPTTSENRHFTPPEIVADFTGFQPITPTEDTTPLIPANSGEFGPTETGLCRWSGCGEDARRSRQGYCRQHYLQARHVFGPVPHVNAAREKSPTWKGDAIGIVAAHDRIRAVYGSAAHYPCHGTHCSATAKDWALIPGRGSHVSAEGSPYSPDPRDYLPLCRVCHKRTDLAPPATVDQLELPLLSWHPDEHRTVFDPTTRLVPSLPVAPALPDLRQDALPFGFSGPGPADAEERTRS